MLQEESDDIDEKRDCDRKSDVLEAVRSIKTTMSKEFPRLLHATESAKAENVAADPNLQRGVTTC